MQQAVARMEMPRPDLLAWAILLKAALATISAANSSCFQDFAIGRLYRTKYEVCSGHDNSTDSEFLELLNVSLSAPFHRRLRRHVFWRFNQVQICLAVRAGNLAGDVPFLQNAAYGIPALIPFRTPFCDMDKDTCTNMRPACGSSKPGSAIVPGQEFCTCSNLVVPGISLPGMNVDITWIMMSTELEQPKSDCELLSGDDQLAAKGKKKLICIKIPVVIRNKPNRRRTEKVIT